MGVRRVQEIRERVVGGLPGRLELEVQILQELDPADHRQLHLGRLAEDRLIGVLQHHLQRVADGAGEQQRNVVGARTRQRRTDQRERSPGQCRSRWNSSKITTRWSERERSASS
jgi:hypothetical protein